MKVVVVVVVRRCRYTTTRPWRRMYLRAGAVHHYKDTQTSSATLAGLPTFPRVRPAAILVGASCVLCGSILERDMNFNPVERKKGAVVESVTGGGTGTASNRTTTSSPRPFKLNQTSKTFQARRSTLYSYSRCLCSSSIQSHLHARGVCGIAPTTTPSPFQAATGSPARAPRAPSLPLRSPDTHSETRASRPGTCTHP